MCDSGFIKNPKTMPPLQPAILNQSGGGKDPAILNVTRFNMKWCGVETFVEFPPVEPSAYLISHTALAPDDPGNIFPPAAFIRDSLNPNLRGSARSQTLAVIIALEHLKRNDNWEEIRQYLRDRFL
ncbi:hypothetical protein HK098_004680 [Nowakowskiella sp. JEL0407]|nr:hypothetical protein HK098_004680 [Nowakowskiella sp. JEL0407]